MSTAPVPAPPLLTAEDDESRTAVVYFADRASRTLGPEDELTVPEILPGFAVPVRRLFE